MLGAFQVTIPVKTKAGLLAAEERDFAVLRWIGEKIPERSRWYLPFGRYLELIGGRVKDFGGNPLQIEPSPTGDPTHKVPHPVPHPPGGGGEVRVAL